MGLASLSRNHAILVGWYLVCIYKGVEKDLLKVRLGTAVKAHDLWGWNGTKIGKRGKVSSR